MKEKSGDRYIYAVFMTTPTGIGKLIRTVTRHPYNHTSLSLYPDLRVLFTFARRHENTPLDGGFIRESLRRFPRDSRVQFKVCRLRLTAEQYDALCGFLQPFLDYPDRYVYNLFSFMTFAGKYRFRLSRSYTCVEFVTDALLACGYLQPKDVSDFCSISELEILLNKDVIYEGTVLGYPLPNSWEGDNYFVRQGLLRSVGGSFCCVGKLMRMVSEEKIMNRR